MAKKKAARGGRPAKPKRQRRGHYLAVRVSAEELTLLRKAKHPDLPLNTWIRLIILERAREEVRK